MRKVLVIMALVATALPCAAADWKLTKEQEARADELGVIDSPIAFLRTCSWATERLPPEEQAEYDKASKDEREKMDAVRAIVATNCLGMIRAVAETVLAGAPYRVAGGDPICIDPEKDVGSLLKVMTLSTRANTSMAEAPGMTTPLYILRSLKALSDCNP